MKIIQYRDGTWGAKKRGWFGWKYLNEIYDGCWNWHYSWRYQPPEGNGCNDKFRSKKACIKALSLYYHGYRRLAKEG